ncbi:MAG TPA: cytochrome c oxidase subunit II [Gemmatimonadales bacterium]|jgi:cytochrome c oxidase subunit 2
MHIHVYERVWMWSAAGIIALFLSMIAFATISQGRIPPSHVETVDPRSIWTDARFANRGVTVAADGSVTVTLIAMMYAFQPNEIRVPPGRPVTFRIASADVVHGFQIVGTNGNTMIVPGYVSQFTMTFPESGEYLITCNEFCGVGHHGMYATLIVEAP